MAIDLMVIRWRIERECSLLDHNTSREQIVKREIARGVRECQGVDDLKDLLEAYWLGEFDATD